MISVDPDQVLLHAASGRSLYCSQIHIILKINNVIYSTFSPVGDIKTGVSLFHFYEMCVLPLLQYAPL